MDIEVKALKEIYVNLKLFNACDDGSDKEFDSYEEFFSTKTADGKMIFFTLNFFSIVVLSFSANSQHVATNKKINLKVWLNLNPLAPSVLETPRHTENILNGKGTTLKSCQATCHHEEKNRNLKTFPNFLFH